MTLDICLNIPNLIGYGRIALVLAAWRTFSSPGLFLSFYLSSILLDGVDGWAARRLDQSSRFGAWLDVAVDNMGRSMLWNMLSKWGWLIASLEWVVFVCNHSAFGAHWKSSFDQSPNWVRSVMAKGFRSPLGVFTIAGLHLLPVWLYGYQYGVLSDALRMPDWMQAVGLLLLAAGRLLCVAVEMWCIWIHIRYLTNMEDAKEKT